MAGGPRFIWILLLLSCVFQAENTSFKNQEPDKVASRLEHILSKIVLPDGIDPKNVNVNYTAITLRTCVGLREQLELLNGRLEQTALRNKELDDEAFGLRRDVRLLNLQLATCRSTASAITGSYQTQLQSKLQQMLDKFDSDQFQILKIIALTREVETLQKKITSITANSTETSTEIRVLQTELQNKINELNAKRLEIERSNPNTALIFQIISQQNQIWDLEEQDLRRGGTGQPDQRIMAVQAELDQKISELGGKEDAMSSVLELVSVYSKIAAIQRLIAGYIERSRTDASDYQRQLRLKVELLKKKILQLNRDENNKELTSEIMILQGEVAQLRQLILKTKTTSDSQLQELRFLLEVEKKRQENLQKQLEETEFLQTQLIIKIISTMKEIRELQSDDQKPTSGSQATTLQALLQTKEKEYAKAQDEIKQLQRELQLKNKECSGLEEKYMNVKTEFEQKVAELNRAGDSEAALVLNVINLHDELKTLNNLISTTDDNDILSALQRQLEEKQEELNSKTADIERLIANPKTILTIIDLQNEIWGLQNKAANGTTSNRVTELQARLNGLISEIDDKDGENTKLTLTIVTLQSQVEQLQKQLSDVQVLQNKQVTQLKSDLLAKRKELMKYVNELQERNQTNARLILTVTDLQNQLRNLEDERRDDLTASTQTISQLRKELVAKKLAHTRDRAEINRLNNALLAKERECGIAAAEARELQKKLRLKKEECSGLEESYKELRTEFEQKVAELNRTGDSKAALVLSVINLHNDLRTLRDLISNTDDPAVISSLQRQLEEKQEELNSKTADIERLIANPKIILTVIELQNEIWDLQKQAANGTTSNRVTELQSRVDGLIGDISGKDNENTKLMLQILTLQSQVEQLQRQLSHLKRVKGAQVAELLNELTTKKNELQKYVAELNERDQTNSKLILTVADLNNQLRNLQDKGESASATVTQLRGQLKTKVEERSRDQEKIKALENKLIETEARCSDFEQKITNLQNDMDSKVKQLQSKSDSVSSLALQVSTLTLQTEELKKQLQNTVSKEKTEELQKQIDEKNKELAKATEELKARSPQPQRLLQIIAIDVEIERYLETAKNETDYAKIGALQDHLNYLLEGIQDEENENTKLVFQVLAQKDEVARLKKQKESLEKALSDRIKELENELEDIRNQIKEKTLVLSSSDMTITNQSAQIMELHQKIKPLENEISDLKDTYNENLAELQRRLDLAKKQLEDSELRLQDAEKNNFKLIMEITDLRTQLKKAQKQASKAVGKNIPELEEQLITQQRENKKLENSNRDLKQNIKELQICCNDDNTHCEDLQRKLQQSQEDADRLQQQLQERDDKLKQLQQDIEEQHRENNRRQHEYSTLERQLQQTQDTAENLRQQLHEKDALFNQVQQELEDQTKEKNKLQDDYTNLQNEKNSLEDSVQELQNKLSDVEDQTIYARKMTFDPNTAHPRVTLSADNTEMSTSEEIQDVPDNSGRFDVALATLGSIGFSTGRQYWEVSVAGKNCFHIGMASESSPRKGAVIFTPTNGFWTVVLNKQGQYRAIDRRPAIIPAQAQLLTLGVLLDYKKGQISFYNSGARSHLYSFVGQRFTDKIYPFVNFCVEDDGNQNPIVLLPPGSTEWIK